ncbi:hypothetical protein [Xanthomonas theicola]|uniref:hypothetical protein n=1 Tax=Xanthomonas theicola TaxID=56464 RepID=UPI0036DC8817
MQYYRIRGASVRMAAFAPLAEAGSTGERDGGRISGRVASKMLAAAAPVPAGRRRAGRPL